MLLKYKKIVKLIKRFIKYIFEKKFKKLIKYIYK